MAQYKSANGSVEERKEFWLTSFAIRNRTSVLALVFMLILSGLYSYINVPREAQPNITIPFIIVVTLYPGVSPEDVETQVTQKLEDKINEIANIKNLTSTSLEGYSNIVVEFNTGIDIDEALQKVREKVDLAKPELPSVVEDPLILEQNFSEFPILQVNIAGNYSFSELTNIAEDIQEKIEAIPQVLEVDRIGSVEKEVKVEINLSKLKYYGVGFNDVLLAIQKENISIPGGNIESGTKKYLLRIPGEYSDPYDIENIVVDAPDGLPIQIKDVADISFGFKDRESYATLNGSPVITLSVKKRSGENIVETAESIKTLLKSEEKRLGTSTDIEITGDQSVFVNSMVSNLENNIISGLILVVGVLLFFLGVRNAFFVGISIPMSMFITFVVIGALGLTLNMMVLFSLILALGMLVDNAIVVVENIYRYIESGYDNFVAARKATGEVAVPIIAGTTTTLAAFFPLTFWDGIIGEFMSILPKTLIIALASSLFVALVINPVLCALFMRRSTYDAQDQTTKKAFSRRGKRIFYGLGIFIALILLMNNFVSWLMMFLIFGFMVLLYRYVLYGIGVLWQNRGYEALSKYYGMVLTWSLKHPVKVFFVSIFVLFMSMVVFMMFNHGVLLFPDDVQPTNVMVQLDTPEGTNVAYTDRLITALYEDTRAIENIEDLESTVTSSGSQISSGGGSSGQSSHLGTVMLNFKEYHKREYRNTKNTIEYLRQKLPPTISGGEVNVEVPDFGPPTGTPISLEIVGEDIRQLKKITNDILTIIEEDSIYAYLDGLSSNLPESRPELVINVNRERAALFKLDTRLIGNTIREAVNGVEASKYRDGTDEYDIIVRLREEDREDVNVLSNLEIKADKNQFVPLSEVAQWSIGEGLGGILHKDLKRVVTIGSDVRSYANPNQVLGQLSVLLDPYLSNLPPGYTYSWTGEQEDQQESLSFLFRAFMIAIFLIMFILISQFNSVGLPFIILSSVFMSLSGVLYGMVILGYPFSIIMTGIGIVSLAGIVVNNAIVLIDYIQILRERDNMTTWDALITAGKVRLRPVILTAITTTLGLIPMALGFNIDYIQFISNPLVFFTNISEYIYWGGDQAVWWGPMATAVITGLLFATVLTLIFVPVIYLLFGRIASFGRRLFIRPNVG